MSPPHDRPVTDGGRSGSVETAQVPSSGDAADDLAATSRPLMRRVTDSLGLLGGLPTTGSLLVGAVLVVAGVSLPPLVQGLAGVLFLLGALVGLVLVPCFVVRDGVALWRVASRVRAGGRALGLKHPVAVLGDVLARIAGYVLVGGAVALTWMVATYDPPTSATSAGWVMPPGMAQFLLGAALVVVALAGSTVLAMLHAVAGFLFRQTSLSKR